MGTNRFASIDLPEETQDLLDRYLKKVTKDWSAELEGLFLYGSAARGDFILGRSNINILGIFQHLPVDVLQNSGRLHRQWGKHKIVAPLLMTENEINQSARVFPLEFLQILDHHVLLHGQHALSEGLVDEERLRWQCSQELFGNLLQIRQRFIEGEGRAEAIQSLLILSITAVLPCLRGILKILGEPSRGVDIDILDRFERTTSFEAGVLMEVLRMKRGLTSPGSYEWPKLYSRYLDVVTHLSHRSKEWCG